MSHRLAMWMLEDTAYGYCEECHQTGRPTTIEFEDGSFDLICSNCAERAYSDAESIDPPEDDECTYCVAKATDQCLECRAPLCAMHTSTGSNLCDYCESDHGKGWSYNHRMY